MFRTLPYKLSSLREWNLRMSRFDTPAIFDPVVEHVLLDQGFDTSNSSEPRSVYSVQKLYEQLEGFAPDKTVNVAFDAHVRRGVSFAYSIFAKPKGSSDLEPLQYWNESIITNWKASAGLTAFGLSKREAFSRGVLSTKRILEESRKPEPCIALTRTSQGGKSRLVWGYPMSMTLLEGSFARPLLEQFKGGNTSMAFATTNKTLGAKILSASHHNKYWYSLDASQFDATVQQSIIRVCFDIIRTWFDTTKEFAEGRTIGEALKIVEEYFIYTPIVMPTGDRDVRGHGILTTGKRHGVPSGSYFTQLVDSISNIVILGALSSKFGFQVSGRESFVLGDDLLFFTNSHLNLGELAAYASKTFGMKFNPKKSQMGFSSEEIPFLGRTWERGLPKRTTTKAVDRMLWPETYRSYSDPKREGRLVVLSYNLTAIQDVGLIPDLSGWRSLGFNGKEILQSSSKTSGLVRFMMTHTDFRNDLQSNSGSLNMLKVLL